MFTIYYWCTHCRNTGSPQRYRFLPGLCCGRGPHASMSPAIFHNAYYKNIFMYWHVGVLTCVYIYWHVRMHVRMCACMLACTRVRWYVCMYVGVHTCVHISACGHGHELDTCEANRAVYAIEMKQHRINKC